MSGDTVTPTPSDFQIAFRGMFWQLKAHGVEFTWETRSLIIHLAECKAADAAYLRLQSNSYHRILGSGVLRENNP